MTLDGVEYLSSMKMRRESFTSLLFDFILPTEGEINHVSVRLHLNMIPMMGKETVMGMVEAWDDDGLFGLFQGEVTETFGHSFSFNVSAQSFGGPRRLGESLNSLQGYIPISREAVVDAVSDRASC